MKDQSQQTNASNMQTASMLNDTASDSDDDNGTDHIRRKFSLSIIINDSMIMSISVQQQQLLLQLLQQQLLHCSNGLQHQNKEGRSAASVCQGDHRVCLNGFKWGRQASRDLSWTFKSAKTALLGLQKIVLEVKTKSQLILNQQQIVARQAYTVESFKRIHDSHP